MARTRYGLIGVVARGNYLDGCVCDNCEIEVTVTERLAIHGRNLHFAGGISSEAVGEGQSGGFRNDRGKGEYEDEDAAYGGQ